MLKVVKGFEVCGREFARHWVDLLTVGIRIVGIHLNLCKGRVKKEALLVVF